MYIPNPFSSYHYNYGPLSPSLTIKNGGQPLHRARRGDGSVMCKKPGNLFQGLSTQSGELVDISGH